MGVLNSFFARGVGNSPIKKFVRGFCPGGWSGLELTDTLDHQPDFYVSWIVLMASKGEGCRVYRFRNYGVSANPPLRRCGYKILSCRKGSLSSIIFGIRVKRFQCLNSLCFRPTLSNCRHYSCYQPPISPGLIWVQKAPSMGLSAEGLIQSRGESEKSSVRKKPKRTWET